MLRGFRIGQALGTMAIVCAAAAFAVPAGAQKATAQTDTTHAAKASDDTVFQSEGMQEFEARRKRGAGYFMTHAQLRRNLDRPLAEIVATHFPGLRMVYGPHLDSQYLVSLRGEGPNALVANGGTSLCYVQVFVDGTFIIDGDVSWINPNDVAGLEFYDATRTPPAYRRADGQCGVLLVWSRTGGGN